MPQSWWTRASITKNDATKNAQHSPKTGERGAKGPTAYDEPERVGHPLWRPKLENPHPMGEEVAEIVLVMAGVAVKRFPMQGGTDQEITCHANKKDIGGSAVPTTCPMGL